MNKFLLAVKSRTIWTIVITFAINGLASIKILVPISWLPVIDLVLGLAVIYFHINPRVDFNS